MKEFHRAKYNTRVNDRPGTAVRERPYDLTRIGYRNLPGQSRLFLDLIDQKDSATRFYPNAPGDLLEFSAKALAHHAVDRNSLCEFLTEFNTEIGSPGPALENIERLRSGTCVAVLTGQQAGLFGGPAYTIYKAVSAIRLASDLTAKGIEAVPVFWIASEDHDLEEVRHTSIPGEDGSLETFGYEIQGDGMTPVGSVPFDGTIRAVADSFADLLGAEKVSALVTHAYSQGETFSSAFARLISGLLGDKGLIVTSPMEDGFRKLALPVVRHAVERADYLRTAVRNRDRELARDGYHSQVRVNEDFFPFFLITDEGKRVGLTMAGSGSVERADTGEKILLEKLASRVEDDPSALSPGALMRPVVQDYVFPTVCYLGGSAEIAYFAQNSTIYEELGRPVTPIRHRASFTVADPRNRRTMNAYQLDLPEIAKGRESVAARITAEFLDPETVEAFDNTQIRFDELIDDLHERLKESEPTLAESLSKRREKILYHITTLREKFLKAEAFKDEVAASRLEHLFNTLFPDGGLQERKINSLYFPTEFGERFIDWLIEEAETDDAFHKLITF